MKKINLIIITMIILMTANVPFVHAVEVFEGVWRAISVDLDEIEGVILGAGILYSMSPYKGLDDQMSGVPVIIGKYKNLYLDGNSVGYVLNDDFDLIFSVIGQPRFSGYDASESGALAGMQDREWSFDGGLKLSWNSEYFLLSITGLTDLLSEHNGHEVKLVLSREFFDGGITPRVGVKWLSDNLIEYYFGIGGNEAVAGRPAYEGGSTVDYIAGVSVAVPIGEYWALYGDFEYEKFGSEIEDSPIVDESNDFSYMAGGVYRF